MPFPATMLLTMLASVTSAQDANCDFSQTVKPGKTYYIYSPGYPRDYAPGVQCRWLAHVAEGYILRLQCKDVALPSSTRCRGDHLLISKTGDPQLNGASRYCGKGRILATSTKQSISVGLIATRNSTGGRFLCELDAVSYTPPCSCGYKKVNRIVGGEETGVNEYPMMAAIMNKNTERIICGAVIIDNHYVMTAAHCLVNANISDFQVVVGEHNTDINDSPAMKKYAMVKKKVHPKYDPSNFDYDICVVRVAPKILFSDRVGPVCLPFQYITTNFTGKTLSLLGWGTIFSGGPSSKTLLKANVSVINQDSCKSEVPSLTARQFCTYTPGKDACQGDSGGPALYMDEDNRRLYSVGIISNGRFCAERGNPGVETRVTVLLDWIIRNTPGANFCRM